MCLTENFLNQLITQYVYAIVGIGLDARPGRLHLVVSVAHHLSIIYLTKN